MAGAAGRVDALAQSVQGLTSQAGLVSAEAANKTIKEVIVIYTPTAEIVRPVCRPGL